MKCERCSNECSTLDRECCVCSYRSTMCEGCTSRWDRSHQCVDCGHTCYLIDTKVPIPVQDKSGRTVNFHLWKQTRCCVCEQALDDQVHDPYDGDDDEGLDKCDPCEDRLREQEEEEEEEEMVEE